MSEIVVSSLKVGGLAVMLNVTIQMITAENPWLVIGGGCVCGLFVALLVMFLEGRSEKIVRESDDYEIPEWLR